MMQKFSLIYVFIIANIGIFESLWKLAKDRHPELKEYEKIRDEETSILAKFTNHIIGIIAYQIFWICCFYLLYNNYN